VALLVVIWIAPLFDLRIYKFPYLCVINPARVRNPDRPRF